MLLVKSTKALYWQSYGWPKILEYYYKLIINKKIFLVYTPKINIILAT